MYDRFGHAGVGAAGAGPQPGRVYTWSSQPGGMNVDLDDLFGQFDFGHGQQTGGIGSMFDELFGRGRTRRRASARQQAAPPPQDVEQAVPLSFEQAARGTTMSIKRTEPGQAGETIQVRVPPGVAEGQRIRVRGKGQPGPDGRRGDLYIICRVKPHPYFRRDGKDIYLDVPVTITEAALGTKLRLPTLGGTVEVNVAPGTPSGKKLRLRGRGLADPKSGQPGDQYVVIKIVAPTNLNDRQRELFEELAKLDTDDPRAGMGW
jgi:DnaJ-class molecular chaperone